MPGEMKKYVVNKSTFPDEGPEGDFQMVRGQWSVLQMAYQPGEMVGGEHTRGQRCARLEFCQEIWLKGAAKARP